MDGPYRAWQDAAVEALAAFRPFNTTEPHLGDVVIELTVAVPRPKKTVKLRPSGDVDNYAKGLYDAITKVGGFWEDDDQIVHESVTKLWADDAFEPGYHVTIRFL